MFNTLEIDTLVEGLQCLDASATSPEEQTRLTQLSVKVAKLLGSTPPILTQLEEFEKECIQCGFGYRNKENAIAKLVEEFDELIAAIESEPKERQEEELGDLLYMIVSTCRLHRLDAQKAGDTVVAKLRGRIELMRSLSSVPIGELSDDEQTALLREVKSRSSVAHIQNDL